MTAMYRVKCSTDGCPNHYKGKDRLKDGLKDGFTCYRCRRKAARLKKFPKPAEVPATA